MATQTETFQAIRALGLSVRKLDGEIQVKPAGAPWDGDATYFTNCLDDALATARAMAASEGFPVYFTSRAAIEAAQRAVKDELSRADQSYVHWSGRHASATTDQWRAQCLQLAQRAETERNALSAALTALEG